MAISSGISSSTATWLTPGISLLAETTPTLTAPTGASSETAIDSLYTSDVTYSQSLLDYIANTALGQGIDFYQQGNYNNAINSFKNSAGLSPFSDNSAKAYTYIAQAYLKQDKTDDAIKTYKEAIRIYPVRDDLHLALGDIYMKEGNADLALTEYKAAVRLDRTSANNRYSLGQSYLNIGRLSEARAQFQEVIRRSPNSASGYYGLGQVARAAGDYQDAIAQLTKAVRLAKNFNNAYLELGYTYADMGNVRKANDQVSILAAKGSSLATTLQNYISAVSQPQITYANSPDGFNTDLGPATSLASLDAHLMTPDSTNLFSMNFVFSKDMDAESVQNRYNWSITRATVLQNSGVYNGGLPAPATEAAILPVPVNVTYNAATRTATVRFRISQNATGNATLDPGHIVFKFAGLDVNGKAMDTSADQYSGFSGIA